MLENRKGRGMDAGKCRKKEGPTTLCNFWAFFCEAQDDLLLSCHFCILFQKREHAVTEWVHALAVSGSPWMWSRHTASQLWLPHCLSYKQNMHAIMGHESAAVVREIGREGWLTLRLLQWISQVQWWILPGDQYSPTPDLAGEWSALPCAPDETDNLRREGRIHTRWGSASRHPTVSSGQENTCLTAHCSTQ